jgi:hypothetical protein
MNNKQLDMVLGYLNEGTEININEFLNEASIGKIEIDCNKKDDESMFNDAIKYLKKHWEKIFDSVAKDTLNYIKQYALDKDKLKFNNLNSVKKSLKSTGGRFLGSRNTKDGKYFEFALHFEHPVPDKDLHTIFLDDCMVSEKEAVIGKCTFEG